MQLGFAGRRGSVAPWYAGIDLRADAHLLDAQRLHDGGETSGAAVQALGVRQMRIGPQIDPGVPWCFAAATACDTEVHLALKSGNFGGPDFFHKSFKELA